MQLHYIKKIGKLINEAETTLSSNVLLETVLQMVYKHQKQELEKELLDFLGTGNIDLVSLLLQHRRMIVATPIETTILLIKKCGQFNARVPDTARYQESSFEKCRGCQE